MPRILTPEQKERQKRYLDAWRRANPSKILEYSRTRMAVLRSDPDRWASHIAKRKLQKRKPGKPMTPEQRDRYVAYHREYNRTHPLSEEAKAKNLARYYRLKNDPVWLEKERLRQRSVKAKMDSSKKRAIYLAFLVKNPNYHKEWEKEARKSPRYAMECRLRSRLAHCLRRVVAMKSAPTMTLLGCSSIEFKAHIEGLFLPGMTWENRSAWHIDHIRPCASFDLTDPEQQRCCFHYSNLQPLWAADNMRKRDKWEAI